MTDLGHPLSNCEDKSNGDRATKNNSSKIIKERYQILTELGKDKISKTYLAEYLGNSDVIQCVVKHFSTNLRNEKCGQEIKNYFHQSVIILNRLGNHEQIPKLLDSFEEEEDFYLVLEYIEGDTFQEKVKYKTLTESEIVSFLCDVLKILNFVHNNNLIHENIQPKNLIIRNSDKKLFLVDFLSIKNNNNYILKKPLNSNSDIYALGRTAIYGLTGKLPSELEDSKTSQLVNWHHYCQVDLKLRSILDKMTASEDRYRFVLDILKDLQPLLLINKTLIGRYQIENYLGGEHLTDTFLARQLWQKESKYCLVKQVSLPLDRPTLLHEVEFYLAQILEKFSTLNNCSQIQKLIDRFEYDQKFYLVQEFIEGTSLEETLQAEKYLDVDRVILLLQEVLEILKGLHHQGIIHQNIKPSNIIRRLSDRRIVLTNFGAIEDFFDNLTPTKLHSNCSAYAAPEQLVGRPTFSSDIYALGTIAIQSLTGINPRKLRTRWNFQKIIWQSDLHLDLKLKTILNKMIDTDLSKRYQSAQKVIEEIQQFSGKSSKYSQTKKSGKVVRESVCASSQLNFKKYLRFNRYNIFNPKYIGCAILTATILLTINEYFAPTLRPLVYVYLGKISLEKQPQQALVKFQQAIDLDPEQVKAWQGRGNSLDRLGRFQEALSAFDEAIALNSKDIQNWQSKANTLLNLQEFDEAISIYNKLLKLNPQDSNILQKKGKSLANLERDREALIVLQKAIDIDPNNIEAISDLGNILIKLRQYKEALIAFGKVQQLEPQQPRLWQDKAVALDYLGRSQEKLNAYNEALTIYDRSLDLQPDNLDNWIEKGKILTKLGRYSEAIKAYHQAIAINVNSDRVWQGKGEAFFALGNFKKALESFDKAVSLVPKSYTSWRERGLVLSQEKRYPEAIFSFQKAIDINPKDYKSWFGKGLALASLQQSQEALIAFDRAAEIMPQDASFWLERGSILARLGKYAKACDSFERATTIDPRFSPAIETSKQLNCQ